jgi:hypothetical protein
VVDEEMVSLYGLRFVQGLKAARRAPTTSTAQVQKYVLRDGMARPMKRVN